MDVVIKLTTVTNPRFHFVLFSVIYYQCFEAWETLKNFSAKSMCYVGMQFYFFTHSVYFFPLPMLGSLENI